MSLNTWVGDKKYFVFFYTYPNVLLHINELIGFIQVKAIPDTEQNEKRHSCENNLMCLRNLGAGGLLQLDWEVGGTDLILLNLESASFLEAWILSQGNGLEMVKVGGCWGALKISMREMTCQWVLRESTY